MAEQNERAEDVTVTPALTTAERRMSRGGTDQAPNIVEKKKPGVAQKTLVFLYDPKRRTVLGRDSLNWGKSSDESFDGVHPDLGRIF